MKSLFESLHDCSRDALVLVLLFLQPEECQSLHRLRNHALNQLINSQYLWRQYIEMVIPGLNDNFSGLSIDEVKDLLSIQSYRLFYYVFRALRYPFLGWFRCQRADKYWKHRLNGGLICIRAVNGQIEYFEVNHRGGIIVDSICNIQLDEQHRLLSVAQEKGLSREIKFDESSLRFLLLNDDGEEQPLYSTLIPINIEGMGSKQASLIASFLDNDNSSSSVVHKEMLRVIVESFLGVFTSMYGGHGDEMILSSLQYCSSVPLGYQATEVDAARDIHQVHGLKVVGDANVPSGELSFIMLLDEEVDSRLKTELARNEGFGHFIRQRHPTLHLTDIIYCFEGYGQINALPPQWDPSWLDCTFLLLRPTTTNGDLSDVRFSIVWEDWGHFMHFREVPLKDLKR